MRTCGSLSSENVGCCAVGMANCGALGISCGAACGIAGARVGVEGVAERGGGVRSESCSVVG
jgi:hypothetical protein